GTIAVFDNGHYRTDFGRDGLPRPGAPLNSAIVTVDPRTGASRLVYGRDVESAFRTIIRGKHDPTSAGGYMITEFEAGRIFEVDGQGNLVWEFINRFDDTRVIELTEGRLYERSYFSVSDWSCPGN
ncbi:MAG: arylsulfotransferase family protein, partial [Pseudomonadota bacterium]